MASLTQGTNFPLSTPDQERRVNPAKLHDRLLAYFASDPLTSTWASLLQDARYRDLHSARNFLTHRAIAGRVHHMGGADDGISNWGLTGGPLHPNMLVACADQVSDLLTILLPAVETFALTHC